MKKSLFTRVAESLFGVPPTRTITHLDVHEMNGVIRIGEYQVSKDTAYAIALELLKRSTR